jgi:hypothetical protein
MFPANCVSDSPNASRIMHEQAKANAMIAEAEDILFTAEREPSRVAILYPRSSEMWDEWHTELASGMCMCCCVSSMVARYIEYTVEAYLLQAMQHHVMQLHVMPSESFDLPLDLDRLVTFCCCSRSRYGLYLALATDSNIPVDFLDEDALEEPAVLAQYKLILLTEPDVPAKGMAGLLSWVDGGGTLVAVSGAGSGDEYNMPSSVLSDAAKVTESPRKRLVFAGDDSLPAGTTGTVTSSAIGGAGAAAAGLSFTAPSGERLACAHR